MLGEVGAKHLGRDAGFGLNRRQQIAINLARAAFPSGNGRARYAQARSKIVLREWRFATVPKGFERVHLCHARYSNPNGHNLQ